MMGIVSQDQAGTSVSSAGDVNGDGFADLLVGAPFADPGTPARGDAGQSYVVFGRDFSHVVTGLGDANANSLQGTAQANILIGGLGADTLLGAGGADVLGGGGGNDLLAVADLSFRRIDGGGGTDTLRLDGSGLALNLANISATRLRNVEQIDLTGTGDNSLTLTQRDVLRLSPTNRLLVQRNNGDTVTIGPGWSLTGVQSIDGNLFNVFRQGAATLLVQAVAEGAPWQNPAEKKDVNNDSQVAPDDALVVINYINSVANQNQPLPNPPIPPFAPPPLGTGFFYDVNGDGFASPLDPLIIINFLNCGSTNSCAGEGEGESANRVGTSQVLAELSSDLFVGAGSIGPFAASFGSNNDSPGAPTRSNQVEFAQGKHAAIAALLASSGRTSFDCDQSSRGKTAAAATDLLFSSPDWEDGFESLLGELAANRR